MPDAGWFSFYGQCLDCGEDPCECDDDRPRVMLSDDDWCPDCGETRPCSCDDAEDGWFDDSGDSLEDA